MQTNKWVNTVFFAGLVSSLPAIAQPSAVIPPPAIQAIDTHLQQKRTREQREQREVYESRSVSPLLPAQPSTYQTGGIEKTAAANRAKNVRKQDSTVDEQNRLDRSEPLRASGKSSRNQNP